MSSGDPLGWLDRLVGAAIAVLVAAMALYAAVQLIRSVWVWLAGLALVAGVVAAGVVFFRRRYGRW